MKRGYRGKTIIRFIWPAAVVLLLLSCTQEHLIFLMNLQRANLLTLEQIVQESGLESRRPELVKPQDKDRPVRKTLPPAETGPAATNIQKRIAVSPDEDFSITLSGESNTVIVKSLQGGISFLKEKSDVAQGTFVFRNGTNEGQVHLQAVGGDGKVRKNLFYTVVLQAPSAPHSAVTSEPKKKTVAVTNAEAEAAPTPNLSQMIVSATEGLTPTEAVRELQKMMDSASLSDADREIIRYKMVDILIDQRSFARADSEIGRISSERKRDFYRGRFLRAKNNGKEAVRSYLSALGGDDETRKAAILELEQVVIGLGAVDKGLIATLIAETKKFRNQPEFYGESMIAIARIYQYVPDVYAARDILLPLLQGDWPETVRARAQAAYDELQREFLDYR